MITHCPVCQQPIYTKSHTTKSHETYKECLQAIFGKMAELQKIAVDVMQKEVSKRNELETQLQRVYELRESE